MALRTEDGEAKRDQRHISNCTQPSSASLQLLESAGTRLAAPSSNAADQNNGECEICANRQS